MKDKSTFVLFMENREYIDQLSDDQAGRLFKAVFAYEEDGTVPDFSDDVALSITFGVMRKQLDYMNEQYAKNAALKSEAGKKGMAARWDKKASDNNDITDDNTTITENNRVITDDNRVITENNTTITDDNRGITEDNLSVSESVSVSLSANADKYSLSGKPDGANKKSKPKVEKYDAEITEIVEYLNARTGKNFFTRTEPTRKAIRARLNEGHTVEDFKRCIDSKVIQWLGTENDKYLRPETLFSAKHFDSYKNETPHIVTQGGSPSVKKTRLQEEYEKVAGWAERSTGT